jgi:hypothetical protein
MFCAPVATFIPVLYLALAVQGNASENGRNMRGIPVPPGPPIPVVYEPGMLGPPLPLPFPPG